LELKYLREQWWRFLGTKKMKGEGQEEVQSRERDRKNHALRLTDVDLGASDVERSTVKLSALGESGNGVFAHGL
jgi:hypothetical protein